MPNEALTCDLSLSLALSSGKQRVQRRLTEGADELGHALLPSRQDDARLPDSGQD
jgi:hypothetical protein